MDTNFEKLSSVGLAVPEILLPAKKNDIKTWSAPACDQFTQDRDFWKRLASAIGGAPSTLHMILPEVYIDDDDRAARISAIHTTMRNYVQKQAGVFSLPINAGIFVERTTEHGTRRGLVAAIDLEQYNWAPEAKTLIRASEGVIPERIPPRMEIRRNAPVETPHIILLINDEDDMFFPLIEKLMRGAPPIYDGELAMGGGSVKGRLVCRKTDWSFIADYFIHAKRQACTDYGEGNDFVFAVGDGNHSLAAAKAVWEEHKKENAGSLDLYNHPIRWALVEIENTYDSALVFEPIHRLILGVDEARIFENLKRLPDFSCREAKGPSELLAISSDSSISHNRYGFITKDKALLIETSDTNVATVLLDPLLQAAMQDSGPDAKIDYIHGTHALFDYVYKSSSSAAGILLPPFNRKNLFATIAEHGPLPRKSFSMGEPLEKRYYLESRRISGD
ncbi:MAG: DUF1015 domain-containing protein [Spirochaetaceae bacterium]|nr:DUF1015 domain-containing protein [Spirochaetaceae bacterium]